MRIKSRLCYIRWLRATCIRAVTPPKCLRRHSICKSASATMHFFSGLLALLWSVGCNSSPILGARLALDNSVALSDIINVNSSITLSTQEASNVAISAPAFQNAAFFQTLNTTQNPGNAFDHDCEAELGTTLNLLSCFSAMSGLMVLKGQVTFGSGGQPFHVKTPRRYSSCESSVRQSQTEVIILYKPLVDGTCVFDIALRNGAVSDKADWQQIFDAARYLTSQCVEHKPRSAKTGGIVKNLGSSRHSILIQIVSPNSSMHNL